MICKKSSGNFLKSLKTENHQENPISSSIIPSYSTAISQQKNFKKNSETKISKKLFFLNISSFLNDCKYAPRRCKMPIWHFVFGIKRDPRALRAFSAHFLRLICCVSSDFQASCKTLWNL